MRRGVKKTVVTNLVVTYVNDRRVFYSNPHLGVP